MAIEPTQKEWTGEPIRVGVIGGSGLYKLSNIETVDQVNPLTVRRELTSLGATLRRQLRLVARVRGTCLPSLHVMACTMRFRRQRFLRLPTLQR